MKKTTNISLNGRAFIAEEDAYTMLKEYIDEINRRLDSSESEIINDIESRIAELLFSKVSGRDQVVNIAMVQNVIATIGAPHYFGEGRVNSENDGGNGSRKQFYATPPPPRYIKKRLFRDGRRAMLGGVCAGLASYIGADIVLIRALAIILFFMFGFGLIPYLILWIVIPEAVTQEEIDMVNGGHNKIYRRGR